jgi:L,D-peptidoglycan transpeptidase YkuD (ErfK/YbiS/YcfS/YnhG family)
MPVGRVVAAAAACVTVAGCAVVALKMGAADTWRQADTTPVPSSSATSTRPVILPMSSVAPARLPSSTASAASSPAASTPAPSSSTRRPAASHAPSAPAGHRGARVAGTTSAAAHPASAPGPRGQSLPLRYSTGTATRVITVTAHSTNNTTATLQAWTRAAGGGWRKYGGAVTAHVGADGLTSSPSEFRSATPMGSFTLTHAFGYYSNPGTALSYFRTTPADWWISQSGPLYNTHQRCSSSCPFNQGDPNEHLYYETPYYNYAVVINTPSGRDAYPHGSAFFLHVTDGQATAGCVAITQSKLVSLMRWLTPGAHPRILIGVA